MKTSIIEKIKKVFIKKDLEETDVVFILSRIRKILEIDKDKKDEYKKLKFFCNWALHSEVEDTGSIGNEIEKFTRGEISSNVFFELFHQDMNKFLNDYNILTSIRKMKDLSKFDYFLAEIFRDSPLIIKSTKKKKLTITEVGWEEIQPGVYSVPMTMTFTDEKSWFQICTT